MANNSIFEAKKGFLSSQIHILAQPLQPSTSWQDDTPQVDEGDISNAVVQQVLQKLNLIHSKHQNLVFSSAVLRHVAQQIDELYWQSSSDMESTNAIVNIVDGHTDLTNPGAIDSLPEVWPENNEGHDTQRRDRYQELVAKLSSTNDGLISLRQKHAYYTSLRTSLQTFTDPVKNIQPNIVVKDGDLIKELDKSRVLAARLADTIRLRNEKLRIPDSEMVD